VTAIDQWFMEHLAEQPPVSATNQVSRNAVNSDTDKWSEIEIKNVIGALAVHVDARRWNELMALFAPEVRVDYTSLFGGEPQTMPREQLIAGWRELLPGFTHTTHLIGTPVVTISGDTGQCAVSVVAWHWMKDLGSAANDYWVAGGCYEVTCKKLDGAWRIRGLTLARAWAQGNLDLPRIARERAATSASTKS